MDELKLSVDRDGLTGGIQISINLDRPDGTGHGYRIAGPKYCGMSSVIKEVLLTERDAREIRSYLDSVFPPPESPND